MTHSMEYIFKHNNSLIYIIGVHRLTEQLYDTCYGVHLSTQQLYDIYYRSASFNRTII